MAITGNMPFQLIDWTNVEKTVHPGQSGAAFWKTLQFDGLRIRMVEYTPGYLADHWCSKGHIVHCLEGSFESEMQTGEICTLSKGMTYIVSDDMGTHRSSTANGVKLLIIDGDFFKAQHSR